MLYGFVTSRWVQAANPDDAEVAGIESVRAEFVDLLRNRVQRDPAPMMYLVDIDEIARIPDDAVNSGASWFPMEED